MLGHGVVLTERDSFVWSQPIFLANIQSECHQFQIFPMFILNFLGHLVQEEQTFGS